MRRAITIILKMAEKGGGKKGARPYYMHIKMKHRATTSCAPEGRVVNTPMMRAPVRGCMPLGEYTFSHSLDRLLIRGVYMFVSIKHLGLLASCVLETRRHECPN